MTADPFILVLGFIVGVCATLLVMQFRDGDLEPPPCDGCHGDGAMWFGEADGWLCVRCAVLSAGRVPS